MLFSIFNKSFCKREKQRKPSFSELMASGFHYNCNEIHEGKSSSPSLFWIRHLPQLQLDLWYLDLACCRNSVWNLALKLNNVLCASERENKTRLVRLKEMSLTALFLPTSLLQGNVVWQPCCWLNLLMWAVSRSGLLSPAVSHWLTSAPGCFSFTLSLFMLQSLHDV